MTGGHCGIRENDERCPESPAYIVVFDDCQPCQVMGGFLFCAGHRACIEHTAKVRTNRYAFQSGYHRGGRVELSGDATPCRVRSREVAAT